MALTQTNKLPLFGRGTKATYDSYSDDKKEQMIFFATDEKKIYMNDVAYDSSISDKISGIIASLAVEEIGGTGKVITSISETDGILSGTAIDLNTSAVARTATEGSDTVVALSGVTTEEALIEIATYLKSLEAAAATYTMTAVTENLEANVKEQFQLYQTVNGTETAVGDPIKVYKDSAVQSAQVGHMGDTIDESTGAITTGDGDDCIEIVYLTADGTYDLVQINVADFLRETEFANGLQVVSGVVQGKVDTTSEAFLTVGVDGFKLDGVSGEIASQVAAAVAEISGVIVDNELVTAAALTNLDTRVIALETSTDVADAVAELSGALATAIDTLSGDIAAAVDSLSGDIAAAVDELSGDLAAAVDSLSGQIVDGDETTLSGAMEYTDTQISLAFGWYEETV